MPRPIFGDPKSIVHESAESLEAYVLGHLSLPETARLEEHVLWCGPCQEDLDDTVDYVEMIRAALTLAKRDRHHRRGAKRKDAGCVARSRDLLRRHV